MYASQMVPLPNGRALVIERAAHGTGSTDEVVIWISRDQVVPEGGVIPTRDRALGDGIRVPQAALPEINVALARFRRLSNRYRLHVEG
jgi:hypothetical protein